MTIDDEALHRIFDRTAGRCHLCGRRLARNNYANAGRRGAWEVDHSRARAVGGGDRLQNLFPAHVRCNRSKQAEATRSVRRRHGLRRSPMSRDERRSRRASNSLGGAGLGFLAALILRAPLGPLALVGGIIGAAMDPESR